MGRENSGPEKKKKRGLAVVGQPKKLGDTGTVPTSKSELILNPSFIQTESHWNMAKKTPAFLPAPLFFIFKLMETRKFSPFCQ